MKKKLIKYRLHYVKDNETSYFDVDGFSISIIQSKVGEKMKELNISWLKNKMSSEQIN